MAGRRNPAAALRFNFYWAYFTPSLVSTHKNAVETSETPYSARDGSVLVSG
jgi:hypothetical protein